VRLPFQGGESPSQGGLSLTVPRGGRVVTRLMDWAPYVDRLRVCAACSGLHGSLPAAENEEGDGSAPVQLCRCGKPGEQGTVRSDRPRWRGFDFNEATTLCHCCGMVPLPSGSKWSSWFCLACIAQVRNLNDEYGMAVVPVGRHSLMNGVSLKAKPEVTEAEFDAFASGLGDFIKSTERLDIWARRVVARNVAFVDPSGNDPSLEHYVAVVQRYAESNANWGAVRKGLPYSKTQAFTRMRRFMLGRARPSVSGRS
jgi:hypothetical protein